jgi:hypothetical protein
VGTTSTTARATAPSYWLPGLLPLCFCLVRLDRVRRLPHLYTPCFLQPPRPLPLVFRLLPSAFRLLPFAFRISPLRIYFVVTFCTSAAAAAAAAAARHVSQREQAQNQNEDGHDQEDALDGAVTADPSSSEPELFRAANQPLSGHFFCAAQGAGTCAAVASRVACAEAQSVPEHAAVGEQRR